MDKLIVAIIGIAITAAALYTSSDYLTAYYQTAQARAKAQQWLTEAAQIAVAARQAGYVASGSDNWTVGTAAQLVPTYMSDLPKHSGSYVFAPCYQNGGGVFQCPRNNTDAVGIGGSVENRQVCEEIQKLVNRGDSTLTRYTPSGYPGIAKGAAQPIICAWLDMNSNSQHDSGDVYAFYQRIFLDR